MVQMDYRPGARQRAVSWVLLNQNRIIKLWAADDDVRDHLVSRWVLFVCCDSCRKLILVLNILDCVFGVKFMWKKNFRKLDLLGTQKITIRSYFPWGKMLCSLSMKIISLNLPTSVTVVTINITILQIRKLGLRW